MNELHDDMALRPAWKPVRGWLRAGSILALSCLWIAPELGAQAPGILIRGGTVIDATGVRSGDVLIRDGIVVATGGTLDRVLTFVELRLSTTLRLFFEDGTTTRLVRFEQFAFVE